MGSRRGFLLQFANGFEDHITDDGEAARAHFVERVLRGVPVAEARVSVEVDDVDGGHAAREKRLVVVAHFAFASNKNILVAEARGFLPNEIGEPLRRIRFAHEIRDCLADHIGKDHRLHAL